MAELLLHVAFVDLGRGGQAGAQRMARELPRPFCFGEVAAHAGGKSGLLDEAGDMFVAQCIGADRLADDAAKDRPAVDPGEFLSAHRGC